jgi:Fe2+ transport system protein FeoA
MEIMISLLEARKNVPLVVKSVERGERGMVGMRGRGGRRKRGGGGRRNWCRRFSNMGIREGAIIRKITMHPFAGPVIVRIGNCEIAVGRAMASTILVEEAGE